MEEVPSLCFTIPSNVLLMLFLLISALSEKEVVERRDGY